MAFTPEDVSALLASKAAPFNEIALRPAARDDRAFAKATQHATMRPYIEALFGWDETRQDAGFAATWRPGEASIIEWDGEPVGWLSIGRRRHEWSLNKFHVAPEHQGYGVGGHVLRRLTADAGYRRASITLQVFKNNPARRIYERFGFAVVGQDPVHWVMRRDPPGAAPNAM